ncbi:MAG: SDR family oxidoreductase [Clostridia bacterium]|nr:SDR family oxidoreductase [Clostridia bacterium]
MKALITGASSGIGMEIAKVLDGMGIETVLVARREDRLRELAQKLQNKTEIIAMDLSIPGATEELFEKVPEIDILVNNAGFGVYGKFDITDLEREKELIALNITALHSLTKLYLPRFKAKNKGYILNVASIAAFLVGPIFSSYYASKAYVLRLSQAIHRELKKDKSAVKISCLCPGPVVTEFNQVAGVNFGPLGMRADKVAKIAVNGMFKGKQVVVPGGLIKCCRFFAKILPESLTTAVVMMIQSARKLEK